MQSAGGRAQLLELTYGGAPDLPFEGDEELLRRMTLNLLDNAIRYTPPGGRVTAELEGLAGGVLLRISDNGVGIAPEAAPHVLSASSVPTRRAHAGMAGLAWGWRL